MSRSSSWEMRQDSVTTTTAAPATTAPTTKWAAPRVTATTVRKLSPSSSTTTTVRKPAPTATTTRPAPKKAATTSGRSETGGATWYDAAPPGTCAHRTLPFGTLVTITNLSTGATATCTVEDRGPYVDGLVIDLAKDVFSKLASLSTGTIQVRISW